MRVYSRKMCLLTLDSYIKFHFLEFLIYLAGVANFISFFSASFKFSVFTWGSTLSNPSNPRGLISPQIMGCALSEFLEKKLIYCFTTVLQTSFKIEFSLASKLVTNK